MIGGWDCHEHLAKNMQTEEPSVRTGQLLVNFRRANVNDGHDDDIVSYVHPSIAEVQSICGLGRKRSAMIEAPYTRCTDYGRLEYHAMSQQQGSMCARYGTRDQLVN